MFSVIIPTYNRLSVLPQAIGSVVNQVFHDWELIIVDDGSTDNTFEFIDSLNKSRIVVIRQNNLGVCVARNAGSKVAKGNYLIFLDSDDQLLPNALEDFKNAIFSQNSSDLILAGYLRRNLENENYIYSSPVNSYSAPLSGTFAIKKEIFIGLGGYDENIKFGENTEFFHRFNLSGFTNCVIDSYTLIYNDHFLGGSKNLLNSTHSLIYMLNKHNDTLSEKVKFLYHQILGVNFIRFRHFSKARFHLKKAFFIKPTRFDTLGRLVISLFPFIAKKLYSREVEL
ncbi:glycosyltransferase involved in cell wall biosynthesis [Algoriphagus iocasae]|uniref:Glycosyltransferase involved in cell wall biosynthesis n=1 Tax=Algoriphagus iocasae TaxID=1836499 RepID=A0A841MLR7_9BACT|nr:glycosyltransferase family A protein [Algoriphagus iocasae]MBB6327823.1 glycosyltransferase involved in cell wall biosynthesis [Algoriphagus iocasae]